MNMILVTYVNGRQRLVEAQSWRQLDSESAPLGAILLQKKDDGSRLYAIKAAIQEVEEIPAATWEKMKKDQEKAESDHKAAEAQKAVDAMRARKPINKVRKLFGLKAK